MTAGSRLVGRAAEMQWLEARLDRARQARGGLVLLSGEAGVGKSRLTAAFGETLTIGAIVGGVLMLGAVAALRPPQTTPASAPAPAPA